MIPLEDLPFFSLAHDSATAGLYATWQGSHGPAATKQGCELVLQHTRATKSIKLVNDSLLDQNGWQELTDWIATDYSQQLASAGMQAIAWVLPRDNAAFYDTTRVLARIERPVVDVFLDVEAAYAWLQRWPNS